MDEANNLLVRHLPACLTFEEKEDLLKHFGATDVTVMGSRGKLQPKYRHPKNALAL
jgi:hypothetical protein